MSSINRVLIVGRVVRDFEVKYTASSSAVAEMSIAVNGTEKVDGQWKERVEFIDVTVWGEQAEACAQHLGKGSLVGVDGKIRQDRWEKDGQKRSKIKVVAQNVQFLNSRGRDDAPDGSDFGDATF